MNGLDFMTDSLNETPRSQRFHIGIFGRRNSGKSSLINAFAGQHISIVSDVAGTTTDPVYKSMELHGIGPCVLIDTAGFDDIGELGKIRVEKTALAAEKTDAAVILLSDIDMSDELRWFRYFTDKNVPVVLVISKADSRDDIRMLSEAAERETGLSPIIFSSHDGRGTAELREALIKAAPHEPSARDITGSLAADGDSVLLVMPQDIQAPQGRLILPQVQTIRELLDKKCVVTAVTTDRLDAALASMKEPPKLIITDSQVFAAVWAKKPPQSRLTSFSVLFAAYKGDINYFCEGAAAIDSLSESSHVLIAECCTHAPLSEDIGRVKLPALLRKRIGGGLTVSIVSGSDFPADLSPYDLIIQCGACMFNRRYVMSRVDSAKVQSVPMTNYGVAIAYLTGILDKIDY